MVTVKEPQTCRQFSAWNSPNLDHMPLLQLEQNYILPCVPPSTFTANAAFPGYPVSDLPGLKPRHQDAVDGFLKLPPLNCDTSNRTRNPYSKDSPCALLHRPGVTANPIDASCTPQKRFLIVDQSGNHTRLFFSPSFSLQNQIAVSKIPTCADGLFEKLAARVDDHFSVNPIEEKWDENHLTDGEGEMLEDTEEINALLYSDSEEEYDGDDVDGENDEVTSTGQTPFSTEEGYDKYKLFEKLTEEVASSDDSPKRQKLLDGSYKKSSLVGAESTMKLASSCSYEDDVESSCAGKRNSCDDIDSSKREKKVKIHEALKILQSIIPGFKSKDPLSIIDKAIVYLKFMKIEAESLGLTYPNGKFASFP